MHRSLKLFASIWALVSAGFLQAADPAPVLPVINITQVDAADPNLYADQIARINEVMKAKFGVDQFLRVYLGEAAGKDTGAVFAVSRAESFAVLMKNGNSFLTDPALAEVRASLNGIRELGPRTLLKAVRFEGTNPNAALYNSFVAVTDEAGYLMALQGLRALFDSHGLKDAKINVSRVIAGRSDYTHLVSINTPSSERLAVVLDAISSESWAIEWLATLPKLRTVVRNGTYREISR